MIIHVSQYLQLLSDGKYRYNNIKIRYFKNKEN